VPKRERVDFAFDQLVEKCVSHYLIVDHEVVEGLAQAVEMRTDKGKFSSTSRSDASMAARSRIAPVRSGCDKRPAPHQSGGVPGRSLAV
jgi:hypothetical protein